MKHIRGETIEFEHQLNLNLYLSLHNNKMDIIFTNRGVRSSVGNSNKLEKTQP